MFANLFKSRTARKHDNLKSLRENFVISDDEYFQKLYLLDESLWKAEAPKETQEAYNLTQKYNSGKITKEQYAQEIKEYDIELWKTVATDYDIKIEEIENQYDSGQITESQYHCELATLEDRPFIDIVSVNFDVDNSQSIQLEFLWNDKFIEIMREYGYTGKEDEDIVNQWYITVSTVIAAENESVIVTNPEDIGRFRKKDDDKREYY